MSRVTSLTHMPEQQLNRWIKRLALLFFVVLIAFVAFYAFDRFRMPAAPIVDRELAALEEQVRADPADAVARGQLGDRYFAKGRYEDAIAQYTALINANKEIEQASFGRARAYQQMGQYDSAIPDFEKVVAIAIQGEMAGIDPMLAASYFGLGTIATEQGRSEDAVANLEKALAIQRTDGDTLYALANAYLSVGKTSEAIEKLTLATTLVPVGWPEPYLALETAYTEAGQADQAEWAGAMAAFAAGDNVTAKTRLEAIVGGDEALEALTGLGLIAEIEGDTAAAAGWFTKALAIDPDDVAAKLGLARVTMPAASPAEGNN